MTVRRLLPIVGLFGVVALSAACGKTSDPPASVASTPSSSSSSSASSSAVSSSPASAPGSTSASSPSTAAVSTTPASTPATLSGAAEFSAAKAQWVAGATAAAAIQGEYWTRASADLTAAVTAEDSGTTGFHAAAVELTELTALPDTMLTPAQQAQAKTLVAGLDSFFGTPGLYS